MSGLDNIVEEIRNQSKQEADEILKEADVFCKDYMNKIKKDVEVEVVSIEKKACLLYTSDAADDLTRVDLGGRRIIKHCLLYTSPSPRDTERSRMPSSA